LDLSPHAFFNLESFEHRSLFDGLTHVWEALKRVEAYLAEHLKPGIQGEVHDGAWVDSDVYIGPGAVVEPGALVKGPTIIGAGAVVRHGAYVRGNCVVGKKCVVGHATELKHVIMLDGSQAAHFNYVGDSILGAGVNLGAGTKLSNLKNDGKEVVVRTADRSINTGMRKLGAVLGDRVHMGCNSVTSPGTLVGPGSAVYPNAVLRGVYPAASVIKLRQHIETVPAR